MPDPRHSRRHRTGRPRSAAATPLAKPLADAAAARNRGDQVALANALIAVADLSAKTGTPVATTVYYEIGTILLRRNRLAEAERYVRQGALRHPGDFALHNLLGVVLKNLGRYDEALQELDTAARLDPANLSPTVNSGNIHLLRRDGIRAEQAFRRGVAEQPDRAEFQRLLGGAVRLQGRSDEALRQFETARNLDPGNARAWIDAAGLLDELGRAPEGLALLDQGLATVRESQPQIRPEIRPEIRPLAEARLTLLRRLGQQPELVTYARSLVERFPDQAWVHMQFARCVMHTDRRLANKHLREAVRLEPDNRDAIADLADSLDRTRGPDEGDNIAEAYELAKRRLDLGGNLLPHARIISSILNRACDFDRAARIGGFEQLTRYWADVGFVSALHYQMAQVVTRADRDILLDAHRKWGRTVDAIAERSPLSVPYVRRGRAKLRLGLMSSDLRNHPVSYFALPLIEGYDRERFELYCYSWNSGAGDPVQTRIASLCDGFRLAPAIGDRDAAALIARDGLDMLIELGGTTYMNKLNVMAWKPAPIQASWLGYPHSAGPETIDYIVLDPYNRPVDDALLIERPLVLKRSWVVLGAMGFNHSIPIEPGTPEQRVGHLTFGTMNNPYKYTRDVVSTWARVVRAHKDARFLFVRPEAATPAFRTNVQAVFEANGVAADRVEFVAVRGKHMPFYNRIDIALDTFPQTGGTTTCEALWMGVPTVSLVGPCIFERLSNSNLTNAGLADLCVSDKDSYVETALRLAADRARRETLRATLRTEIRDRPLGRVDWFLEDFQDAVRQAVDQRSG